MNLSKTLMLCCVATLTAAVVAQALERDDVAAKQPTTIKAPTVHKVATQTHGMMAMQVVTHGELEIQSPMIRATPLNAPVSAGYMLIRNIGSQDDRLIAGSAAFAGKVEIHEMSMDGDVMRMRKIEGGLAIPAGGQVTLERGGLHLMFMQLSEQMEPGAIHDVTLVFEKAGAVTFPMVVTRPGGSAHDMNHTLEKTN